MTGLFLEALMLLFIFNFSWSEVDYTDKYLNNELVFSVTEANETSFCDSDSPSDSIINFLSKLQISHIVSLANTLDLFGIRLSNVEEFSVSQSLFNTFYRHITASAP